MHCKIQQPNAPKWKLELAKRRRATFATLAEAKAHHIHSIHCVRDPPPLFINFLTSRCQFAICPPLVIVIEKGEQNVPLAIFGSTASLRARNGGKQGNLSVMSDYKIYAVKNSAIVPVSIKQ